MRNVVFPLPRLTSTWDFMTNLFQPIAFIEVGQINCFQILQISG